MRKGDWAVNTTDHKYPNPNPGPNPNPKIGLSVIGKSNTVLAQNTATEKALKGL